MRPFRGALPVEVDAAKSVRFVACDRGTRVAMFTRLSIVCLLLFAAGRAMACSCMGDEWWLKSLESQGLPANTDIFRGKVERWISEKEIDVRVTDLPKPDRVPANSGPEGNWS